jgi:hypothetical protein
VPIHAVHESRPKFSPVLKGWPILIADRIVFPLPTRLAKRLPECCVRDHTRRLKPIALVALVKRFAKAGDWLATLVSDLLVDVEPTLPCATKDIWFETVPEPDDSWEKTRAATDSQ